MDGAVRSYIDGIEPPASRALFDRVHELVMRAHPEATLGISYKIPTYRVGKRRLHVAAWKHGLSLYGWQADRDGGFSARHPDLLSGRATLRLSPDAASGIPDTELLDLARAALNP
ncbi:MAG TPA: DUF1801 domain-containing protein [Streptosporangiaceae bacterium]|jgi:hypothetical protein